jgi:hypothetical protein
VWLIPTLLPRFAVRGIYVKKQRLCGSFDIPAAGGLLVCVPWLVMTWSWQYCDTMDGSNASLLVSVGFWFVTLIAVYTPKGNLDSITPHF